jgi:hypothetical protein
MTDKLTVRELINGVAGVGKFDPLTLDTSEIKELSNQMPKDGNIDLNNAEVLAVKYLRGADICAELLAIATAHANRTKHLKEVAYSRAFLKSRDDKSVKTDKMRAALADIDDEYTEACNAFNEALAFRQWVDAKYKVFNTMHYMCKSMLQRGYDHERASGFNGSVESQVKEEESGW